MTDGEDQTYSESVRLPSCKCHEVHEKDGEESMREFRDVITCWDFCKTLCTGVFERAIDLYKLRN